jgi:hypothetical protein
MKDPGFRAEFERASREIKAIDAIVNELDSLRPTHVYVVDDVSDTPNGVQLCGAARSAAKLVYMSRPWSCSLTRGAVVARMVRVA